MMPDGPCRKFVLHQPGVLSASEHYAVSKLANTMCARPIVANMLVVLRNEFDDSRAIVKTAWECRFLLKFNVHFTCLDCATIINPL